MIDHQTGALDRGAAKIPHLARVVEATRTMHHRAIVPHHQIVHPPLVRIDEPSLRRVLHQVAEPVRLGRQTPIPSA